MSEPARRPATWDDLLKTPDDGLTYEILDGQLEAMPRPLPRHGHIQVQLATDLNAPFGRGRGGPGGWWITIEPDVALGANDFVVPDLAGWRRDKVPDFPEERPITAGPDWLCEILSPKREARDRVHKANLYLRAGVPHYWIVDPEQRTLEAFAAREGAWVRAGAWTDGDRARIPPFDAVEIDIGGLFPPRKTT